MKASQELSILFWLRRDNKSKESKATLSVRITIAGERDGFSLGYQVHPSKFDAKAAIIIGKSAEAIEINKHILHVRSELLRHSNPTGPFLGNLTEL